MSTIAVIGAGFSGLSAACYLADKGHDVHVFEKNATPGGRARQWITSEGFVFDMGPSWYWMPDVFERFFNDFGFSSSQFYALEKLHPAFDMVFGHNDVASIPQDFEELCHWFERTEPGSAERLKMFMQEAEYKYNTGMNKLVYKPGRSILEFAEPGVIRGLFRLQVISSFSRHIRKYFTNKKLLALMEFPVLFLGAMPQQTPALYSLMNYAGLKLGTWYPQGGFGKVVDAFVHVAESRGVQFHYDSPVEKINTSAGKVISINVHGRTIPFDGVIAAADYHHIEHRLLTPTERNYTEKYWESKTLAPSCLVYYLGVNRRINSIHHHTLFFDHDLSLHAQEIYKTPRYPTDPLFYMCCPSRTDDTVTPAGCENIFLLMPLAPGLHDTEEIREKYFNEMLDRIERLLGESFRDHIIYKKSYSIQNYIQDYNAYKGNAYGLANTLMQTAVMKPGIHNRKIRNLFYAGQMTVPGPGVPPAIISGKIAAGQLLKVLKNTVHETSV